MLDNLFQNTMYQNSYPKVNAFQKIIKELEAEEKK